MGRAAGALLPQGGAKQGQNSLLVELSVTWSRAQGLEEFPGLPSLTDRSVGRLSPLFDLEIPNIVLDWSGVSNL